MSKLVLRGSFGAENFDYVKIGISGCDLGDECLSEDELMQINFNFIGLNALPELLGDDPDNFVTYLADTNYVRFIDPLMTQKTNYFFMKSVVSLEDNVYDVVDMLGKDVEIFELSSHYEYPQRIPSSTPLADR